MLEGPALIGDRKKSGSEYTIPVTPKLICYRTIKRKYTPKALYK